MYHYHCIYLLYNLFCSDLHIYILIFFPSQNQWYLDPLKNRPASRADLLEVLKDVKSAQVRFVFSQNQEDVQLAIAQLIFQFFKLFEIVRSTNILQFSISDIYLSTTSDQDNMRGLANLVEVCSCPEGYTGTSCEVDCEEISSLLKPHFSSHDNTSRDVLNYRQSHCTDCFMAMANEFNYVIIN